MVRALAVVVCGVAWSVSGTALRPLEVRGITQLCGIGFTSPLPTHCYPPRRVAAVEARLIVHPVRPTPVVVKLVRLSLARIALYDPSRPAAIAYLYGQIPRGLTGLPAFALTEPHYVLVYEAVGRERILPRHVVYSDGHWTYFANFRCRDLWFRVDSNLSARTLRRIGRGIAASETCHGK